MAVAYTAGYGIEREASFVTTGAYVFKMIKQDSRWLIDDHPRSPRPPILNTRRQ
jgi:hypothetical protein